MRHVVWGTAGHIDHGKTSLIRAVTGIDTDRLKEEKKRGITIELGFASLDLPGGQRLGIVDVPGHEKFVKNMVAGATGIDLVAMIIAADEGVMPQTREHMEICTLLGVEYGLVAVTKIDMVDEEWLELVIDDISGFTQGTFLEDQPVLPVSSVTGQGIQAFAETLDTISAQIPERPPSNIFRLPIDRVFTMKGFGTVITGTLVSGQIQVGDTIMIYPSAITSKVRGLQVHNQRVEQASSGLRTAINFQGLEKAAVNRGEVLSTPGTLKPSYMVDGAIHYLSSNKKPLKNRTQVRFHTGTSEIMGNIILIDREALDPGQATVAQIRLDTPVALVKDDRYVIRSYSPVRTIGGGKVINPIPLKHKRHNTDIITGLEKLAAAAPEEAVQLNIAACGFGLRRALLLLGLLRGFVDARRHSTERLLRVLDGRAHRGGDRRSGPRGRRPLRLRQHQERLGGAGQRPGSHLPLRRHARAAPLPGAVVGGLEPFTGRNQLPANRVQERRIARCSLRDGR